MAHCCCYCGATQNLTRYENPWDDEQDATPYFVCKNCIEEDDYQADEFGPYDESEF